MLGRVSAYRQLRGISRVVGQQRRTVGGGPPMETQKTPAQIAAAAEHATKQVEVEKRISSINRALLFPWENYGTDGNLKPLTWWQKGYWVVFAGVFTWFIGERSYNYYNTGKWTAPTNSAFTKAKPELQPTLFKSRVNAALRGEAFTEEDDPFDGMTPAEIEAKIALEAPSGDAFDGMSPEEIEEYVQRESAERDAIRLSRA